MEAGKRKASPWGEKSRRRRRPRGGKKRRNEDEAEEAADPRHRRREWYLEKGVGRKQVRSPHFQCWFD